MRKVIVLLIIFCLLTSTVYAQWSGAGAWGAIRNFLRRCTTSIIPSPDNTFDLGSPTRRWRNIYTIGTMTPGVFGGDLIPLWDDTYNIGDGYTPRRWKDLHISGDTYQSGDVYIDGTMSANVFTSIPDEFVLWSNSGTIDGEANFTYDDTNNVLNLYGPGLVGWAYFRNDGAGLLIGSDKDIQYQSGGHIGGLLGDDVGTYRWNIKNASSNEVFSFNSAGGYRAQTDKYVFVATFTDEGINAAIDQLGVEGGEAYLPEGTYVIDAEIDIDVNHTILTGSGWGTILDSSGGQAYGHVINGNANEYITIQNLQILGSRGDGDAGELISLGLSDYSLIQNCYFQGADDVALDTTGQNNKILDNHFYLIDDDAVVLHSATGRNLVQGNTFYTVEGDGVNLVSTNRDSIIGNTFYDIGGYPIRLNSCDYTLVSSNVIYNTDTGAADIRVSSSDYNTIIGNNCNGSGTSDRGIYIHNSDYNVVEGNTTNSHDVSGIETDGSSFNNSIAGNVCQDTTPYADSGNFSIFSIAADAVPTLDDTYDLGNSTIPLRWRNLNLSGDTRQSGSVYLDGTMSAGVFDGQYLEYSGDGAVTVRDSLIVEGTQTANVFEGGSILTTGTGTFNKLVLTNTDYTYDEITFLGENFTWQSEFTGGTGSFVWVSGAVDDHISFYLSADGGPYPPGTWAPYFGIEVAHEAPTIFLESDVAVALRPNADTSDYIKFQTSGDIPEITTAGACDLKITSSSGEIDFDDENLTTLGTGTFGDLAHVLPTVDGTYNLGESYTPRRWRELHISGVTYQSDTVYGTDHILSGTQTAGVFDGARVENSGGQLTFNDTTTGVKTLAELAAAGATAWDDIGNPDAASEIDMGAHITELNVDDFRIGDGGANYWKWAGGAMTNAGTATIDITAANDLQIAGGQIDYNDMGGGGAISTTNTLQAGTISIAGAGNSYIDDPLMVGAAVAAAADLEVGDGTASRDHIDGTDDILVKDDIELDGDLWADGSSIVAGTQSAGVFDGQFIEYSGGGALTVRDGLTIDGTTTVGTLAGAIDAGGATSLEIPNSTDPDITLEGQISWDTDDDTLRGIDANAGNQVVIGQKDKTIQFTIMQPDDLDETDDITVWSNETGFTFNITEIKAWCDDQVGNDGDFTLVEITDPTDFTAETTIEAVTCSNDGTEVDYITVAEGDIDHKVIEDTHLIALDPTTDDLKWIKVTIKGWLDADVN